MSVSKQRGKYSTRSRPRALDTEVVAQVLKLEAWAYLRGEAWKKQYRHTLIEEFRKSIPGGESMSYEEVQQAMQKIVPGTYPVTYKSAKEEALAMYEQELKESSDPYMNGFSEKDDWSLPLKMFGSPTRMLYTDVTLKDGNILPEFSIRKSIALFPTSRLI